MHGISNIAGDRTVKWTVNGREYQIGTNRLRDFAEKERAILSLRPNLFEQATNVLGEPPDFPGELPDDPTPEQKERHKRQRANWQVYMARMKAIDEAATKQMSKAQLVTVEEEQEFDQSTRGIIWRLWQSLRRYHEEFQVSQNEGMAAAADLIEESVAEHGPHAFALLIAKLDSADEGELLGNSDGLDRDGQTDNQAKSTN